MLLTIHKKIKNGMTLIEVLVAMFILTLSLVASLRTATYATSNQILLQERTLAEWVGRNRLAERRIEGIIWHNSGQVEGIAEIGNNKFIWQEKITYVPGSNRAFRLIELTVAKIDKPKTVLFRTLDFARRPNN